MAKLTPAQIIDQVTEPLSKRLISGPSSNESRGYYVIANLKTPADRSTAYRIPTSEYDRRVVQAAAIVMAESGGDTNAVCYNYNNPAKVTTQNPNGADCSPKPLPAGTPGTQRGIDRGLWQWNTVAWPQITDLAAFDPSTSTEIAFTVSNAYTSFGPWSKSRGMDPNSEAFKTIAATYESMLGRAVDDTPILSTIDPDADGIPDGAFGALVGWAEGLGRLLSNLTSAAFWTRVGIGALGVALVVFAVASLGRRTALNTITGGLAGSLTKGK